MANYGNRGFVSLFVSNTGPSLALNQSGWARNHVFRLVYIEFNHLLRSEWSSGFALENPIGNTFGPQILTPHRSEHYSGYTLMEFQDI